MGANVGLYAAEFATQVPEGRILAAEPNSRVFPFLQRTCAGIGPRAFAVRMAASDSAGEAELRFDPMAPAMGGILPGPDGLYNSQRRYGGFLVSERVATVTVDALAAEHFVPDLLKIDAEGADALILKGAEEMLAAHRPALFFEVDRDHERIRAMLESRGYVPLDAELRVKHQALGMCFALHRERHADAIGALCG